MRVPINIHHSQVPDPPEDVIKVAMDDFAMPAERTKMALKCWFVAASLNRWDADNCPDYPFRYAMFMAGFNAGYNLHLQETREIAHGN
jgi:hypothetical protein